MTLRAKLFGAISATLCVVLAVLVALTLTTEWDREARARSHHDAAVEFAAGLAREFPINARPDSMLINNGVLHVAVRSLAVYHVDAAGSAGLRSSWGEIAGEPVQQEHAHAMAMRARDEGVAVRDGTSVAVETVQRDADGRPAVVYVDLRPIQIDAVAASRVTFLVVVAAGAVLLLVAWLFVDRLVANPLRQVVAGAHRVSAGDYGEPIPATGSDDEIQTVIDAFNVMMIELDALNERMQDRIGEALRNARRTQDSLVIAQRLAATGSLAAGIAHEVNNPLGGMLNAVHSLKSKPLSDERRAEYFELVEEGLQRIRATVAKILQFTPHTVAPQALDLRTIVQPVLSLVRHRTEREGVVVDAELPDEPATVFGDFYELQQALLNVVLNALDALEDVDREPPRLQVVLTADGDDWLLRVADNGPGMNAADVPRAFDLFFTTKEQGRGSGLGLATVHKILDDHAGRVELRPHPGEGLEVLFVLPRHRE